MKEIFEEVIIPAKPDEVYDALMDSNKHAAFTGAAAKIENKVGGKFEIWDGYASGKNIELVRGKKMFPMYFFVMSNRAGRIIIGNRSKNILKTVVHNFCLQKSVGKANFGPFRRFFDTKLAARCGRPEDGYIIGEQASVLVRYSR